MSKNINEVFDLAKAQAKYKKSDVAIDIENGIFYFKFTDNVDIAFDDSTNEHSVYVRNSNFVFKRTWKEDADFKGLEDLFEKEEDFIEVCVKRLSV